MSDVEIDVEVITETDDALLVDNGHVAVWIPKSVITDRSEEKGKRARKKH